MVFQGDWDEAEKRYRTLRSAVSEANARVVDREAARLLNRQGRRLEAATCLRELCRFGDVEESELRSLLIAFHPLPDEDANATELEPIGPLGKARYEISQGKWEAALEALNWSTTKHPAQQVLRDEFPRTSRILRRLANGPMTRTMRKANPLTIGSRWVFTKPIRASIPPRSNVLARPCFATKPTRRPTC